MDTRRVSASIVAPEPAVEPERDGTVEIVELSAAARPERSVLRRVVFVVGIAVMAGLIAWAGFPSRTSFAFDTPLPNVFTATPAPQP